MGLGNARPCVLDGHDRIAAALAEGDAVLNAVAQAERPAVERTRRAG